MPLNLDALAITPRLLLEAQLQPLQGATFQPTGFPNLGAATYDSPQGKGRMLLVESAQSVTNWLERALFKTFTRDSISDDLIDEVKGISFVEIDCGEFGRTSTLLESHRLNTPYLWESADATATTLQKNILSDIGVTRRKKKGEASDSGDDNQDSAGRVDMHRFYKALLKYDLNSLIHGIFLEKVAGRLRVPRALSGFVEASNVKPADSGGTKFDHIFPATDEKYGITSKDGFVNVPYPVTRFSAESITAYFNVDLNQIRGYGLGVDAEQLLTHLSLYKLARLLESDWDLRSNCKFAVKSFGLTRPVDGFEFPSAKEIAAALPNLIGKVRTRGDFGGEGDPVRRVRWSKKKEKFAVSFATGTAAPLIPDDLKKVIKWTKETKSKASSVELPERPSDDLLAKLLSLFDGNQAAQAAINKTMGGNVGESDAADDEEVKD